VAYGQVLGPVQPWDSGESPVLGVGLCGTDEFGGVVILKVSA
jgi:hypothetical protein